MSNFPTKVKRQLILSAITLVKLRQTRKIELKFFQRTHQENNCFYKSFQHLKIKLTTIAHIIF
jgi:hypothetical protein